MAHFLPLAQIKQQLHTALEDFKTKSAALDKEQSTLDQEFLAQLEKQKVAALQKKLHG